MRQPVIVEALRTPVGRRNGALKDVRPDHLAAHLLRELFRRTGLEPTAVELVLFGCVDQVGEQAVNIGRNAWLAAALPLAVPAVTLDGQCGSSQMAVNTGAALIAAGIHEVVVAGGVESMSRVPLGGNLDVHGSPWGDWYRQHYQVVHQGVAAEIIADRWNLTRRELDAFALGSHLKAAAAAGDGRFRKETVPVPLPLPPPPAASPLPPPSAASPPTPPPSEPDGEGRAGGRGLDTGEGSHDGGRVLEADEGIRPDADLEVMGQLPPVFREDGRITAGNASQMSDGAAVVLLMSLERALALGLRPRARIRAQKTVGVDPETMLTGPIPATRAVLGQEGLACRDIDLFECNEAFASVVLAWQRELEPDPGRVNVNGGAIALGHPLGATGARLMTTLLHELERRDARLGLQTMCCGGGLGVATILDRNL